MDVLDKVEALLEKSAGKRSLLSSHDLIVNHISRDNGIVCNWFFQLPYGFHSALGLRYYPRRKLGKSWMQWVQTGGISFKEGDLIESAGGGCFLSVEEGLPVAFESDRSIYRGSVRFRVTRQAEHRYSCDQIAFLDVVVNGLSVIDDRFMKLPEWSIQQYERESI